MAVDNDNIERDPHLARLLEAAGGEGPPPAVDAILRAAARREVGARPQVAGGGAAGTPSVRGKRNWYVPMSIAAVLVLSVSLVTLMRQEKHDGDDALYQPPVAEAPATSATPAPAAQAHKGAPQGEPAERKTADAPPARRAESAAASGVPEAAADQAKLARAATSTAVSAAQDATASSERTAGSAPKQRAAASAMPPSERMAATEPAGTVGAGDKAANAAAAPVPAPAAPPAVATLSPPPAPAVQSAPPMVARPEPFPGASEREARAQLKRDAAAAPPAPRLTDRAVASEAPVLADTAPAEAPRARAAARPMIQGGPALSAARPAWLAKLETESPERWLEQLVQFKRDGRDADANLLLVEFRRRFPDHPASR